MPAVPALRMLPLSDLVHRRMGHQRRPNNMGQTGHVHPLLPTLPHLQPSHHTTNAGTIKAYYSALLPSTRTRHTAHLPPVLRLPTVHRKRVPRCRGHRHSSNFRLPPPSHDMPPVQRTAQAYTTLQYQHWSHTHPGTHHPYRRASHPMWLRLSVSGTLHQADRPTRSRNVCAVSSVLARRMHPMPIGLRN